MSRVACLPVSFELLRELLNLPADTEIRFVRTGDYRNVDIVVEHPDLDDVDPMEPLPVLSPTFRTEYQKVAVFQKWGKP